MTTDEIGICCVNVQGIHNNEKRRDIFDRLRNQNFKIICLTDTHFEKSKENIYSAEWGYLSYLFPFHHNLEGLRYFLKIILNSKLKMCTVINREIYSYSI